MKNCAVTVFVGLIFIRSSSVLAKPKREGTKECPIKCTATVQDGGMTSLIVPIAVTSTTQILLSKCNHQEREDCIPLIVLVPNGKVHNVTNNCSISIANQTFTVWIRGEKNESYFKLQKHLDEACLAIVKVTPCGPTVPPSEVPPSAASPAVPKSPPNSGINNAALGILRVIGLLSLPLLPLLPLFTLLYIVKLIQKTFNFKDVSEMTSEIATSVHFDCGPN